MTSRLPASIALALTLVLAAGASARAEQVAALRLQAEVAVEASCMIPPDGDQPEVLARLDADPAAKAAVCRCFAAAVARNAPPADQEELIETQGVPPEEASAAAADRCAAGVGGR
ncbi:hypothetical protein [Caenispirillum bisanense]|uniref:UrcA family protein n=1 Tax=Caenispirillum bisanense TaxID=414052 RepID=A0A286G996_9PROT|nr:hypothetical protein [Caenispirillum bisanense]SOD91786.1 hypothetical protein SAMN05421508_102107 [Caenispirillum bisanense]